MLHNSIGVEKNNNSLLFRYSYGTTDKIHDYWMICCCCLFVCVCVCVCVCVQVQLTYRAGKTTR